ncbi:MAG: hypothetical protein WCI73_18670, partial [Phycisphaerae bacterium]
MTPVPFANALLRGLLSDAYSWHPDNHDADRFPEARPPAAVVENAGWFKRTVARWAGLPSAVDWRQLPTNWQGLATLDISGLSAFYERLADDASRDLLIKVICYQILGPQRVVFPAQAEMYRTRRPEIDAMVVRSSPEIPIPFMNWKLQHYALQRLGFPLSLYSVPLGIMTIFVSRQYEYVAEAVCCRAAPGD